MKIFNRLNKIAFLAFAGLVIGGCGFFGDLFGVVNVDSTQGKFGEGQSVCNTLSKSDIFPRHYGGNFSNVGRFIGITDFTQVEKALGAQIHYIEIKRSEKESVCAFVMATNTDYKQVKLTSQEIARLEKALANSGKYSEYERRDDVKNEYYTAMKFLKYHNKLSMQGDSVGLNNLQNLSNLLYQVDSTDNSKNSAARNIMITRFIHGKVQDERVYKDGALLGVGTYTSIASLDSILKSPLIRTKKPCVHISNAECSKQINEVRAIKNYAESVLN